MHLPLVNDSYEDLRPYVPGKPVSETMRELGLETCIKLASNENPLGPSPKAMAAAAEAITQGHDYPDGGAFYLKRRLSEVLEVSPEMLIIGNGTNELIEMLIRTCVRPGENMVYAVGSFVVYRLCAQAAGVAVKDVPLTSDLRFDLDAMATAVDANTKLVFIANPNNPTGTYVTAEELERFLGTIPEDVVVVLDEAYVEYVEASDYPDGLAVMRSRPRTIVTRTFSKSQGLAGFRVGYGIADASLIDYLNRGRQPFNANSIGQAAALAALDDTEHLARTVELNRREMNRLTPILEARGLHVTPSQANFLLVDFKQDANAVFQKLLAQGIIVRPMAAWGFPTSARITVGTEAQNDALVAALSTLEQP